MMGTRLLSPPAARRMAAGALLLAATVPAGAQSDLYTYGPDLSFAALGTAVDGGADLDGDGLADVLVGAPSDGTLVFQGGAVHAVAGVTGLKLAKLTAGIQYGNLGASVAFVGDIDLDGVPDFATGAPHATGSGPGASIVTAWSGASFAIRWQVSGGGGDALGCAVAAAGDVNLDGYPDIAAGASSDAVGGVKTGRVFVYSGFDGSVLRQFDGGAQGDAFGFSVAGAGDVDLDGWPDLLVGAPKVDGVGGDAGMARLYSGATGLPLLEFWGDATSDLLGWAVAGPGDTDGDGHPDLLVGVRWDDVAGTNSGSAQLYSGASGALLCTMTSDDGSDLAGTSVAGAGDLDADGLADVLVGIPSDESQGNYTGAMRAFSGTSGALLFTRYGLTKNTGFGQSVAGLGDVDADGAPDIGIGGPASSAGGKLWVLSSADCSSITEYGSGCPGSGGFIPLLRLTGCATAGSSIGLSLSDALGGSLAIIFLGPQPVSIPIKGGCTALVDPLPGHLTLLLSGAGAGKGSSVHVGVLPAGVAPGSSVALQALVIDPGVPSRISTSNGVHLVLP